MKLLKPAFEGQLIADFDDKGNIIVEGVPFTPAKILQIDSAAYEAAYAEWYWETWMPEQESNLKQILNLFENKKRFDDLCQAIGKENVIPFIGSGMSVSMKLPTWSDFLRSIRKLSTLNKKELEALLKDGKYEEAVDALCLNMPNNLFDEKVEHDLKIENGAEITGSVQLLPYIFNRLVLTTNLDNVLEELYKQSLQDFKHVLSGMEIADYRVLKSYQQSFLLKIHGDRASVQGRVLSRKEYEEAYKQKSIIRDELTLIVRNQNMLFLGCSLGTDRTVSLLEEIANEDKKMPQ